MSGIADAGNAEWERNVAIKINEYGWVATRGGVLNWHYLFGHIENPHNYLYVNHPPGMIWIYAFFIKLCGVAYIRLIPLAVNFIGLISLYYLLKRYFNISTAIAAALIYSFLPGTLFLDRSLNIIILSTTFWILITIFTLRWFESGSKKDTALVAAMSIVATQADWVSFLLFPFIAMGIGTLVKKESRRKCLQHLILTFCVATLIYFTEIMIYSNSYGNLLNYLLGQTVAGSFMNEKISFFSAQMKILTKLMLYTNPIAVILAVAGFYTIIAAKDNMQRYILFMLLGPFIILLVAFNKFMYIEIPPYKLIAPFIAASGGCYVCHIVSSGYRIKHSKHFLIITLLFFIVSSVVVSMALEERQVLKSNVASKIAEELVRSTSNRDIILTNLEEKASPFPPWEEGGWLFTSFHSDRFLRFDMTSATQMRKFRDQTGMIPSVYMYVPQAKSVTLDFNSPQSGMLFEKVNAATVAFTEEIRTSRTLSLLLRISRMLGLPAGKMDIRNETSDISFDLVFYRIEYL